MRNNHKLALSYIHSRVGSKFANESTSGPRALNEACGYRCFRFQNLKQNETGREEAWRTKPLYDRYFSSGIVERARPPSFFTGRAIFLFLSLSLLFRDASRDRERSFASCQPSRVTRSINAARGTTLSAGTINLGKISK